MSFEIEVQKTFTKPVKVKISNEQEKFCQLYTRDKKLMGDPMGCFLAVYELEPHQVGNTKQIKKDIETLLAKPQIISRINELIEEDGFNDLNVDKQHLFIINQHADLNVKMKGIEHYNKLKKRIDNKIELVLPQPIMDLDGVDINDEGVNKIE